MEWMPVVNEPIKLNDAVRTLCKILKFVAASAAEAELGALLICIRVALDQLPLLSSLGIRDLGDREASTWRPTSTVDTQSGAQDYM